MNTLLKLSIPVLFLFVSTFGVLSQTIDENGTLIYPEGTTSINNSAYRYDQTIKHIVFPSTLKIIGSRAFQYCVYIEDNLVLPEGLEEIGKNAFSHCINIHQITVPASVKTIGSDAFSKNTSLVVEDGSYAHLWAMDNGYDYQFTPEGFPEGVTEVYKDFHVKTAWSQRGGYFQFIPTKERVLCGNLADATIVYHNGWHYQGSKSYATTDSVYYCDFDANRPDYDKIPRTFLNSYTDEEMYDADLLLWQQCLAGEMGWKGTSVTPPYGYMTLLSEHLPAKIFQYQLPEKETDTGADVKTYEELEEILIANCEHPFMAFAQQLGGGSNHGWVVDGVRRKDGKLQLHCNFGWRGDCDGWYNIWEPIVNSKIDYQDPYRRFRFFVPFTKDELANWKPYTHTDEQKAAIVAETHYMPYKEGNTACLPEGTTVLKRSTYTGDTTITATKLPSTIRVVSSKCFENCKNLTETTIPASVESIGGSAFKNCTSLETVHYNALNCTFAGGSTSPFGGCAKTTQVNIADGVKTIPDYIFRYCTAVKEVEIPSSVDSIGTLAFPKTTKIRCTPGSYAEQWAISNGYSLTDDMLINDGVLTIPEGTVEIPASAYAGNEKITAVVLPSTLKKIGTNAFKGCSNLTELTIPDSVEYLSQKAFANCANLRKVNFNAVNCTYAGANNGRSAFAGCTALSEVVIGPNVKSLPQQVFRECEALHSVTIPGNVKTLNKSNFYSSGLKEVVISEGVETINEYAFGVCKSLATITIPASVSLIGPNAFPKTTKVICTAGSYAETWARENGYTVELKSSDSAVDELPAEQPIIVTDGKISGAENLRIFNLLGQDVTHLNGSLRGVYIVKIGYAVEKVIVE